MHAFGIFTLLPLSNGIDHTRAMVDFISQYNNPYGYEPKRLVSIRQTAGAEENPKALGKESFEVRPNEHGQFRRVPGTEESHRRRSLW